VLPATVNPNQTPIRGTRTRGSRQVPPKDPLHVAAERNADLIVIGYQKRSTTGKFLLGSTPLAFMLGAECSVLAVTTS